jgi:hypothetical protein
LAVVVAKLSGLSAHFFEKEANTAGRGFALAKLSFLKKKGA